MKQKKQNKPTTLKDWLYAGLLRFAEGGERNLTVERIAEDLGVSKGSYYYYFPNREDYIRAILVYSLEIATEEFILQALKEKSFSNQLRALIISIFKSTKGKDFDFYFRDFAKKHAYASKLVRIMDDRRISFISELLIGCGLTPKASFQRAEIFYHYYLGWHSRFKNSKLSQEKLALQIEISSELLGVKLLSP